MANLPPVTESCLNASHIYEIGLVAAEWGYAEAALDILIWRLAGIDHVKGRCITTHVGTVTNQDIAKTLVNELLVHEGHSTLRERILEVLRMFDDLRNKRNRIIHAQWLLNEPFDQQNPQLPRFLVAKAKGELKVETHSLEQEHIRNTVAEITNLIWELSKVIVQLPDVPDPRPFDFPLRPNVKT